MTDIIDKIQVLEVVDDSGNPDSLVYLYEIILDSSNTLYFFKGLNDGSFDSVTFNTKDSPYTQKTYQAIPLEITGVEINADGAMNRPTFSVANILKSNPLDANIASLFGSLTALNLSNEDLIGKKLTVRRTFVSNLNQSAGVAPIELPSYIFIIDRISSENATAVEFELASPFDVEGVKIPNRSVIGKYCNWEYQGNSIRSGCSWPINNTLILGSSSTSVSCIFYFSSDDEPLVLLSAITGLSPASWSSLTTYSQDTVVTYGSRYWRSNYNNNLNSAPSLTNINWQVIRTYTTYSAGTSYIVDSNGDRRNNPYVIYNSKIWRLVQNATGQTPEEGSAFWTRADLCGKTLKSCKLRFQATQRSGSSGTSTIPSAKLNTAKTLPFGGFPGSSKFK